MGAVPGGEGKGQGSKSIVMATERRSVAGVYVAADLARIKNTALLAIGLRAEPAANFWEVSFFARGIEWR